MKKQNIKIIFLTCMIILLVISEIFLTHMLFCNSNTSDNDSHIETEKSDDKPKNIFFNQEDFGYNTDYSLDKDFLNDINLDLSNFETGNIIAAYTNKWRDLIDTYCKSIEAHVETHISDALKDGTEDVYLDDIPELLNQSQLEWEKYMESQEDFYSKASEEIYGGGSYSWYIGAKAEYLSCRSRALELYSLCRKLLIEVPAP